MEQKGKKGNALAFSFYNWKYTKITHSLPLNICLHIDFFLHSLENPIICIQILPSLNKLIVEFTSSKFYLIQLENKYFLMQENIQAVTVVSTNDNNTCRETHSFEIYYFMYILEYQVRESNMGGIETMYKSNTRTSHYETYKLNE